MSSHWISRCARLASGFCLLFAVVQGPAPAQIAGPTDGLPQRFVANHGQWSGPAEFRSRAGGATSWFVRDGWLLQLQRRVGGDEAALLQPSPNPLAGARSLEVEGVVLRMTLEGASSALPVTGEAVLPGPQHFLLGDRSQWEVGVPAYERLRFSSVYPGVDVVVRPSNGLFEYDVHLAAGAELSQVVIRCDGMDRLEVGADGSLVMHTAVGEIRQAPPITWQTLPDGGRRPVECAYRVIDRDRFGFAAPDRVPGLPMVIDPDLRWSTYLGGVEEDEIFDIARDAAGTLVVAGYTDSPGFPTTTGAFQTTIVGGRDAFVSALDPSQTGPAQLLWSTFVGGTDEDAAFGVQVDATGEIILVGYTFSSGFPSTIGPAFGGRLDGFVTRLSASGAGLVYSRLLGGTFHDWASDVVIDSASVTTVVGCTGSDGFQTTANAFQPMRGGNLDLFVMRLDALGNVLYSSFLGGTAKDGTLWANWQANPANLIETFVALDAQERLVLTGITWSSDFPVTPGAYQATHGGNGDIFALRLDPTATPASAQLQWSTLLGGAANDFGIGLDVEPSGLVTIGGCTYNSTFPTTSGAFSTTFVGTTGTTNHNDAIVVQLDPAQTGPAQLVYSTFLSGTEWECVVGVSVDRRGYATVTGFCGPGLPTTPGAYQPAFGGAQDMWAAKLNPAGQGAADLIYCSFLGGTDFDVGGPMIPDGDGGALIVGTTWSVGFPMINPYQAALNGKREGVVAHLDLLPSNVARLEGAGPHCEGSIIFEVDTMPVVGNPFAFLVGNAPPSAVGGMLFGSVTSPCLSLLGAEICLLPVVALPIASDAAGGSSVGFVTPPGLTGALAVQTVWLNTTSCAGGQPVSSSTGLGL